MQPHWSFVFHLNRFVCNLTQLVTLEGDMAIEPTVCNGELVAFVDVYSPEGATIVATDVIEVR